MAVIILAVAAPVSVVRLSAVSQENKMTFNKLTPEEERVIVHKGTEPPFSGKYYKLTESGTYLCKRCNSPLYRSQDKFDAGCGWPSFDDEIPGAVTRTLDADGSRTEITCANCGAHLGHVFEGEDFTPKNTRHCVNSISLNFTPADKEVKPDTAYFAGGCFWGTEYLLQSLDGVLSTRVGYMGGKKSHPTYEQVCEGNTGYAETVEIVFDPTKIDYEALAKFFFEIHDPTQVNRQGPDVGSQYRSAVFYTTEDQKRIADSLIQVLQGNGLKVATHVVPANTFWEAEEYHQDYYVQTGKTPYCHFRQKRF